MEDLNNFLRNRKDLRGVFASDSLPLLFEKPKNFIINLDPSYKERSHWVAVKFDLNGRAYF